MLLRKTTISFISALLVFPVSALATDVLIYSQEAYEAEANSLIIDFDDTGGDVTLQFGNTLAEQLFWDNSATAFTFTDDVSIQGTTITLDSDNTGAGASVSIVAEQGSDLNGELRYNSTTNQWEISNNGGAFSAIPTAAGSDADTLDTLDSTQFLRSDTSDSFTSGTLTTSAGTTLNIDGAADLSGATDIIIPNTESNTFTLDQDNTGGDVTLQFGNTLNETLTWDNANTRFTFSDDLRVEGNHATIGDAFIAGDHAAASSTGTLNLGRQGSAWETIQFDSATNNFTFSDDLDLNSNQLIEARVENLSSAPTCNGGAAGRVYHNTTDNFTYVCNGTNWIQIDFSPQVFDGYDNTGNVSLTTTEAVLNMDTSRVIDTATYTLEADDEITFNQDGLYKITGRISVDSLNTSGTQRSMIELRFEEDTGGGFGDVAGAFCTDYMREQANGISAASCSITYIGSYNATQQIRMTHRMSGSTTGQTVPQGSALTIELIRPE